MRRANCAVLLAAAWVLIMSAVPAAGANEEEPAAPSPADEPPLPAGCSLPSGSALLSEFLAIPNQPAALVDGLTRDHAEVEFLIATVPDPRLGFDGAVEAISRALEAAGHTLDRHTLPWTQRPDKGTTTCPEHIPGIALFVRPPEPGKNPRRLLLVYLVGESPTYGVYKTAFLHAAHEVATLRALLPPPLCRKCDGLRLLGPAFSGAASSLEELLEHPAMRSLPFTIISGRATDVAIQPQLRRHARPDRPITFSATVIPDQALQTEFFCYLTETLGADDHDIAVLTESTTVYGQAAGQSPDAPPLPLKSTRCKNSHRPRLTLPVPLHVSRLNAAWAAQSKSSPKPVEKQDPTTLFDQSLERTLPKIIDLSERTDVIPTLSSSTVAATDRALATILTSIDAEKIRYVGLIFTDEQDTVFLAEQVRKFAPDVVLFTFSSDIIYTHPELRSALKGMLVVTPYPLFTRNQQWSYPFHGYTHRIQFSKDVDQGVYNAMVALLDRPDLMIEYSQPVGSEDKIPQQRPPVWLSVVGIDQLFPLHFITSYEDGGFVYRNKRAAPEEHLYAPYQQGTLLVMLLALGLTGVFIAAGYFRVAYGSILAELKYPWALFRLFRRCAALGEGSAIGPHEGRRQSLFIAAIFLPMALLYPFFCTVHFMQLRDGNTGLEPGQTLSDLPFYLRLLGHTGHIGVYEGLTWRVLVVGLVASACQLVFMVTSTDVILHALGRGGKLRSWLARIWQQRRYLATVGLTAAIVFGTFVCFRSFVGAVNVLQRDFNNLVFMRRVAHPAFGLSPLTPLLILVSALQLWGYCHLQRIRLLERMATIFLDLIEELEDELKLRAELVSMARRLESPGARTVVLALLAAVLLVVTVFSEVVSLEASPLNFVFRLLFGVLCITILYASYRFLRLWLHFANFLRLISHHPLAAALDRMPEDLARSIGSLFLEELPEEARREAEQTHLRMLGNHLNDLDLDKELQSLPPGQVGPLRKLFDELRQVLNVSPRPTRPGYDDPRVVQTARLLVQILKVFWQARPLPGTLPEPGAVPATQSTVTAYANAWPSPMVLWLRLAEDIVTLQVVAYIYRLFPHLRNALIFFTGGILLLLAAVVTYPFQPQHFLVLVLWGLIMGSVGLAVMVFVQMNRNETLSRIAKTEPGKISFDRRFFSQVAIYGALPLLSFFATQFPEVRGVAFSWLETLLKTLK